MTTATLKEELHIRGKGVAFTLILAISLVIALAEWVFSYRDVALGVVLALFLVFAIYVTLSLLRLRPEVVDCAEALALIPLYILFTSSLPWFFLDQQFLLPAVYSLILALCAWHLQRKRLGLVEVGLRPAGWLRSLVLGLALGVPLGAIEFFILHPAPAFPTLAWQHLARDLGYMVFFVGIGEELLFRGLIQRELARLLGWRWGLLWASALFMVMHLTWRSLPELGFTFTVGAILGYIYHRTGSLTAPIIIHGVGNAVLVGVMPYLLHGG